MELPLSKGGRRYGYKKDKVDHRDFGLLHPAFPREAVDLAVTSVDLEPLCGPHKDQGQEGACTAFAGTGMREFLYRKLAQYEVTKVDPAPVLSPAFLYYLERQLDGSLGEGDTGSTGRTSVTAMNSFGVCLESEDPYVAGNFNQEPTQEQLTSALQFKAGAYHRLGFQDMRTCLLSGYAFVVGFNVYESFESNIGPDGMMPVPDIRNEQLLGGHEVFFIGFDDSKSAYKVRNSWGTSWGDGGNFWMPYSVAADSNIVLDAWMQHLGRAW